MFGSKKELIAHFTLQRILQLMLQTLQIKQTIPDIAAFT